MKLVTSAAIASVIAMGLAATAHAQTIPNPTNPTPRFPVATDGSPLPYHGSYDARPLTGRSAYAPVASSFNAIAGTGLGVVDETVGAGLGTAGAVVDGTVGAVRAR